MLSSVGLTKRERAVATLVSDGLSNKMIARKLGVTEGTVKVHVVNIFRKVGVRRRVEIILEQNERLAAEGAWARAPREGIADNVGNPTLVPRAVVAPKANAPRLQSKEPVPAQNPVRTRVARQADALARRTREDRPKDEHLA